MAIVRHTPWAELDAVERRMRRFFDDVGFVPAPVPAADVYESGGEYVVELEVPGYEQKDLDIALSDHMLVVKGAVGTEKEERKKEFRLHERLDKSFERRFDVPAEVDLKQFKATFEKGVLKVSAPILEEATPQKIEIGTKA